MEIMFEHTIDNSFTILKTEIEEFNYNHNNTNKM
jgi:hypothetical protein